MTKSTRFDTLSPRSQTIWDTTKKSEVKLLVQLRNEDRLSQIRKFISGPVSFMHYFKCIMRACLALIDECIQH